MHINVLALAPAAEASRWERFEPFGALHAATVLVCAAVMVGVSLVGLRMHRRGTERWLGVPIGVFGLAYALGVGIWWVWPTNFDWGRSLPLHLCDLAVIVSPLAVLTGWRTVRALAYFWGVGLSTQAFFTPVLTLGPARIEFWLFFLGHTIIVGYAVYEVIARGYRPRLGDLGRAIGVSLVYVALVFPLNALTGWNYGYMGPTTPGRPTLLDYLGPWPWRVGLLVLLAAVAMALVWLPWGVAGWVKSRRSAGGAG